MFTKLLRELLALEQFLKHLAIIIACLLVLGAVLMARHAAPSGYTTPAPAPSPSVHCTWCLTSNP